jgi:hypothetical protein
MRHDAYNALIDPPATAVKQGKTRIGSRDSLLFACVSVVVAALLLPVATASAGSADGERSPNRPHSTGQGQEGKRGVGFLPGYEPPEVVEWRRAYTRRPTFWYGGPRFYRGRWNGGGFGPCWTQTPIGPHWNCG